MSRRRSRWRRKAPRRNSPWRKATACVSPSLTTLRPLTPTARSASVCTCTVSLASLLAITALADVSDNAFLVSAVKLFPDGLGGASFDVKFETDAAPGGNPATIELGEALQGHTI